MIPQNLIHYIETEIIPRYEHFDKAHDRSHVQTVIDESLALAKLYPQADKRLVYTIAAYHDTGLCRDRATHHLVSGEIMWNSYERSFVIEYQLYKKNNGTKILLRKKGSIKAVWGIEPNKKVCFWDERFNKNLTLEEYFYLLKV